MSILTDIKSLRSAVEREAAAFAKKKTGLFFEGRPYFADPAMQKKNVDHALQGLRQAVADALELAEKAGAEAKRLASQAHRDPLSSLTTDELQRYSLLRPLVGEQVASLPLGSLADRLSAVDGSGDRVEKMVYLAAIAQRPAEERQRVRPILDSLELSLVDPKSEQAAAEAAALRLATIELSFFASTTLSASDGTADAEMAQRLADYGGPF